jgi:hypothetical protein
VRGHSVISVEDTHEPVGGDEHQGLLRQRVGNRVIVAVEAQVRCFAGAQGLNGVAVERMGGQRQEARPLVGERGGDGALVGIAGHEAGVRDALNPIVELRVEIVERAERAGGKEGIAEVANGALDTAFLISPRWSDRPWRKVVMAGKVEKAGIETNDVAHALEDNGL